MFSVKCSVKRTKMNKERPCMAKQLLFLIGNNSSRFFIFSTIYLFIRGVVQFIFTTLSDDLKWRVNGHLQRHPLQRQCPLQRQGPVRSTQIFFKRIEEHCCQLQVAGCLWNRKRRCQMKTKNRVSCTTTAKHNCITMFENAVHCQCDQFGRFIALWATFQSLWQQIFCQNCSHF